MSVTDDGMNKGIKCGVSPHPASRSEMLHLDSAVDTMGLMQQPRVETCLSFNSVRRHLRASEALTNFRVLNRETDFLHQWEELQQFYLNESEL